VQQRRTASIKAVLLDALGTLVELEPPWVHLAAALGIEEDEQMVSAFRGEMGYYREHAHEGRDEASLADLRRRCAAIVSKGLGKEVSVAELMAAIRFRAFDDAGPALRQLRAHGLRLVCVSNWDYTLPDVLGRVGLLGLLDGVVTSASVGARKPDARIFREGLRVAGRAASEALHVGDSASEDVAGARAVGIRALLLDRKGAGDIATLAELRGALSLLYGG